MNDIFDDVFKKNDDGINQYNLLINGCWKCTSTDNFIDIDNPATGVKIGIVPNCSIDDLNTAVNACKNEKHIMEFNPIERLEIMQKAEKLLLEHKDYIAKIITEESGKPISISLSEVEATAERLMLTMNEARELYGDYLSGEWVKDTKNKFAIVLRKPLGVVAAISSFNYPLFIPAAKIIPAVLAGNTVIAKPSSETPISLILFVRILEKSGMPPGTINIITGKGPVIGDAIIENPDISAISFTGSTKVGEHIAKKSGIRRIHLELGGKAAAIVLNDADLDIAAKQICKGAFRNSGQRCDAVSRVFVDKNIKNKFIERILEEAKKYKTGDPLLPDTMLGAMINKNAVNRVGLLIDDAVNKGAKVLYGGNCNGLFFEATVLDNVTVDMKIAWEEIFGPVMPIIEVNDYNEAVRLSNLSEYGLDSCIFTENINLAIKIARSLQDGSVTINAGPSHGVGHFPFGGNKRSGLGREGLKYSIDELTKLHTIIFSVN